MVISIAMRPTKGPVWICSASSCWPTQGVNTVLKHRVHRGRARERAESARYCAFCVT